MLIKDLYKTGKPVVSLEIFPPKKDIDDAAIYKVLDDMALLSPDFISVTCGAGGVGSSVKTTGIAKFISERYGTTSLAHLTCTGMTRAMIRRAIEETRESGIHNILALRGDLSENNSQGELAHADDLIREIRGYGGFCIGAACYPEGHIDCDDLSFDTQTLRRKQEAGADFLITQLFFDNTIFYRFLERARGGGVTLPVSAGVMPILGRAQIERMIFMCGASLPSDIIKLLYKYEKDPSSLRKAGIEHAARQMEGLLKNGADGVHIYTMNKPDIAGTCMRHIGRLSVKKT